MVKEVRVLLLLALLLCENPHHASATPPVMFHLVHTCWQPLHPVCNQDAQQHCSSLHLCALTAAALQELGRLDEDSTVYKQIGPAMIKQDLVEAQTNVFKRLEFIQVTRDSTAANSPLCCTP
jgi:hypothetical protein